MERGVGMKYETGQKVHYTPFPGAHDSLRENGVIKKIHPDENKAWVVYNCNGEWDKIHNYTAALTSYDNLRAGWVKGARNQIFCEL